MEMERMTVSEAAAYLHCDLKTLARWLKLEHEMAPVDDKYDQRKHYLKRSDVEKLAAIHNRGTSHVSPDDTMAALERHIETLETKIESLEVIIRARYGSYRPKTSPNALQSKSDGFLVSDTQGHPSYIPGDTEGRYDSSAFAVGMIARRAAGRIAFAHGSNSIASSIDWQWGSSLIDLKSVIIFTHDYLANHPRGGYWKQCDDDSCPCHSLCVD